MAERRRRAGVAATGLVAVVALAAGCGSTSGAEDGAARSGFPTTATTAELPVTAPGRHTLEFRPVLALSPAPPGTACDVPAPAVDVAGPVAECTDGRPVARYEVGPVALDGRAVERTDVQTTQGGQVVVNLVLTEDGIGAFNVAAAACNGRQATCPTGQLAIILDGSFVSAPVVQQASFERDQIQISGQWDAEQAADAAARINSARTS